MRTTLNIADDVLLAAKETARRDKTSVGEALSSIARKALLAAPTRNRQGLPPTAKRLARLGIHVLSHGGGVVVTNEMVNRIRDEEGI